MQVYFILILGKIHAGSWSWIWIRKNLKSRIRIRKKSFRITTLPCCTCWLSKFFIVYLEPRYRKEPVFLGLFVCTVLFFLLWTRFYRLYLSGDCCLVFFLRDREATWKSHCRSIAQPRVMLSYLVYKHNKWDRNQSWQYFFACKNPCIKDR